MFLCVNNAGTVVAKVQLLGCASSAGLDVGRAPDSNLLYTKEKPLAERRAEDLAIFAAEKKWRSKRNYSHVSRNYINPLTMINRALYSPQSTVISTL